MNLVQQAKLETGEAASFVGDFARVGPNLAAESLQMRVLDPLLDCDWDRLVLSHPQSNLFHRTAWARVLCRTYGHKPLYLAFSRDDEAPALVPIMEVISPFIGRRGVSVPFSDFCEPLVFGERNQESLVTKLLELGRQRGWQYFEMRGGKGMLPRSAVSGEKYHGHKLDLSVGPQKLFDRFHDSVRRAIRKAKKSGLTVEISNARKAMLDFYRLHVRTRRRHGYPPQPLAFFLNIDEEIMRAGLGFVTLVKKGTSPIAAAVFFCSGSAALFKFGASDERKHEFRGNNLAMWESIKRACEQGFQTLHLGRTSIGDDGLRRFKLSWGTKEEPIAYFKFALRTQSWENRSHNGLKLYTQLFRRLPLAVNRAAGALIYSHLD